MFLEQDNQKDADWHKEKLEQHRTNEAIKQTHGAFAMGMDFLDLGYIVPMVVTGGFGTAVRAGRLATAGLEMAATAGTMMAGDSVAPQSTLSIIGNTLLAGAIGAALPHGGKLVPKNPNFPAAELNALGHEIQGTAVLPAHDPNFVGPMEAVANPVDNLSRPLVPATGEGTHPITYHGADPTVDYVPKFDTSKYGSVTSVASVADIAAHSPSVAKGHTKIAEDAKAVFLPNENRVYLVEGNIKAGDDVKGILLHEVGVHMNGERVLGTKMFNDMLGELEARAARGEKLAKQAFADVPHNTPLHLVREEAMGYFVERNHTAFSDGIIGRFVSGTKAFLRNAGITMKLTDADMMYMIRKAAKGGEKAARSSMDVSFPYAWHGSPTRGINQLDTAFMGAGEGQQAFGWGHYLTSEKGTALDYRNKEALRRGINPEDAGLYRVKFNRAENEFLNLDARVQTPHVQAALDRLGIRQGIRGQNAYDYLTQKLGSQKAASDALYAEGVAGSKYKTGRTRKMDESNSNYVAFHNDVVGMEARYSFGAKRLGQALEVSWSKSMGHFNKVTRDITDTLISNPTNTTKLSVADIKESILNDLKRTNAKWEGQLVTAVRNRGATSLDWIHNEAKIVGIQRTVEHEVALELLRRGELHDAGLPISRNGIAPDIADMADSLGETYAHALAEKKAAGVIGADLIDTNPGFFRRRMVWQKIADVEKAMVAAGKTSAEATQAVKDAISIAIQSKNGWDATLSGDVANAMYGRSRSRGMSSDAGFRSGSTADDLADLKTMLQSAGLSQQRQERIIELMMGKSDEAGRAPTLKSRIPMHMDTVVHGDFRLHDLIDTNLSTMTSTYIENASGLVALAKKDLKHESDLTKLRQAGIESLPTQTERDRFAQLFDDSAKMLKGIPIAGPLPQLMQDTKLLAQLMVLGKQAMFQLTEYYAAFAKFGMTPTISSAMKELPMFKYLTTNKEGADHLSRILAANASEDVRWRPIVAKLEDNWAVPTSSAVQMGLQRGRQLMPYITGMKWVKQHQAKMVGNLIADTFVRAAKGNAGAVKMLAEYGLEPHTIASITPDIVAHGMNTSRWAASTWDAVRVPADKMLDEVILKNRLGEIPHFAHTPVGQFVFTFQSFVLGAHNKVLANGLINNGYMGVAMHLLYQMPLTYAMTAAHNAAMGKQKTTQQNIAEALGGLGALGLVSNLVQAVTGEKKTMGSPGLAAFSGALKVLGAAKSAAMGEGSGSNLAGTVMATAPLIGAFMPLKYIGESLKDNQPKGK